MFIISSSGQRGRERSGGIGVEWIAAAVERCAHYFTDINWMERRRDERGRLFFTFGVASRSAGRRFLILSHNEKDLPLSIIEP